MLQSSQRRQSPRNARQNVAAARRLRSRQPHVHQQQRNDEHDGRDRITQQRKCFLEGSSHGKYLIAVAKDQRTEHDQKSKRQHGDSADEHIGDRFKPQHHPVAHFDDAVGTVESDAEAFDAA